MMTNRELKKLLLKKPYLLNDAFSVGEDEAAALAEKHRCPSIETILHRASLRSDWPPELSATIERLMNEPLRHKTKRRLKLLLSNAGQHLRAYAPRLIPAAAALLVAGFFALTPFGRGLVGNLFRSGSKTENPSVEVPGTVSSDAQATVSPAASETEEPVPSARYLSLDAQCMPDEVLRAYLIETLGAEQDDGEYYLTEAQTRSVCALDLPEGVRDLSGLAAFPALTSLSWHADESVETAAFSELTALKSLDLALPSVREIDLSANTDLVTVALESGVLSLNVTANEKLDSLTVSGGVLSALELGALPELHTLTLSDNALTELDVSGCPKLEQLAVDGNELLSLDLSANKALKTVSLSGNHLRELSVGAEHAQINGGRQVVNASAPFAQDSRGYYYDLHLLVADPSRVSFADEGMHYDPATGILRTDEPTDTFAYRYHTGNTFFDVTVMLPHGSRITIEYETSYYGGDTFVRFVGGTAYMIYNGREKRPPIRVINENGVILNPKLYDVSYSNNVNLGTAFVNVTMHDSDVFAFKTFRIIAPHVTGLNAAVTSSGVRVSWDASAGAESYLVYRCEKPWNRGEWDDPVLLGRTSEPRWSDSSVSSFMNYRYIVQACLSANPDAGGESTCSNTVLYIAAPALLSVAGEADEITAAWSGIEGAEGYELQVSTDPGFSENVQTREFFYIALLEGTVDRLTPGVPYYVRIRAIGFDGAYASPWSNVKSCVWE